MRAAIDIGSNTVRLLIGEVEAGRVKALHQQLCTTRLGDTTVGGKLSVSGREKTIAALQEFAGVLAEWGVSEPPIVAATSAVREAADGADFAREVAEKLGWQLRILAGEQEAACSYAGAAACGQAGAVVIDVGGGSTEVICRGADGRVCGKSVKVGAVRLFSGEVAECDLKATLEPLLEVLPREGRREFVSVGGTITMLAAMLLDLREYSREAVSGYKVSVGQLRDLLAELALLTAAERLARYPMMAGREDIITSGLKIYLELADLFGAQEFVASDAGLLDGLLLGEGER